MSKRTGPLGPRGVFAVTGWKTPGATAARAAMLTAQHRAHHTEVVRNPHRDDQWAYEAVRSPELLKAVHAAIGPDVAVENTFLVLKWPGRAFEVPWHQDGINDRIELHPDRSVAAWVALTDADEATGCLRVVPGSQCGGYLPYATETGHSASRGRALSTEPPDAGNAVPLPARAGDGVLMDVRILHSSGSNSGPGVRIGLNIRFVAPDGWTIRDGSSPSLDPISGTGW